MTWKISLGDCNDKWQEDIFKSAFLQGHESTVEAMKKIHFWVGDEGSMMCAEDFQPWPCASANILGIK